MRARRCAAGCALLVVVSLAAACSGGSKSTSSSSTTSGARTSSSSTPSSSAPSSSSTPATSAPATVTTAPPGGPPPCATTALRGAVSGSNAGAGQIYTTVTLTNVGSSACTLYGYPGVSLSAHGTQLGQPATHAPGSAPALVTLQSGQATTFVLHTNSGVAGQCQTSDALVVYPPNQRAALSIPSTIELCGTLLETSPVGTTG